MMDDETNVWGRELTDEEIEMAAGGLGTQSLFSIPCLQGLEEIGRGVKDVFTGDVSDGKQLIRQGWAEILGRGT